MSFIVQISPFVHLFTLKIVFLNHSHRVLWGIMFSGIIPRGRSNRSRMQNQYNRESVKKKNNVVKLCQFFFYMNRYIIGLSYS